MDNTIEYNGFKYTKIIDNSFDSIEEKCKKCCFHRIDEKGMLYCQPANWLVFAGCSYGKFHWIKSKD